MRKDSELTHYALRITLPILPHRDLLCYDTLVMKDRLWPRIARLLGFSRFSVMEPLAGSQPGWLSRAIRVILALLALVLVLDFNYPAGMPAGGEFDKSGNATWLEARWSDTLIPPEQRMEMAGVLAKHGIK